MTVCYADKQKADRCDMAVHRLELRSNACMLDTWHWNWASRFEFDAYWTYSFRPDQALFLWAGAVEQGWATDGEDAYVRHRVIFEPTHPPGIISNVSLIQISFWPPVWMADELTGYKHDEDCILLGQLRSSQKAVSPRIYDNIKVQRNKR